LDAKINDRVIRIPNGALSKKDYLPPLEFEFELTEDNNLETIDFDDFEKLTFNQFIDAIEKLLDPTDYDILKYKLNGFTYKDMAEKTGLTIHKVRHRLTNKIYPIIKSHFKGINPCIGM